MSYEDRLRDQALIHKALMKYPKEERDRILRDVVDALNREQRVSKLRPVEEITIGLPQ